jgi:hypothetical protein
MTVGLDFGTMFNLFSTEFLRAWTFGDVLRDTDIYEKQGFDKQSAQVCAYTDTKIIAAASALIRVIEANNAKIQGDIAPKS